MRSDFDAVIIGAGFAGLAAASDLAARGAKVLVLEARPHLGGRAASFHDRRTGERVDNGQHVLFGCYHDTFRFLERIGAVANVQLQKDLEVPMVMRDGRRTTFRTMPLPAPWHLLAGLIEWDVLDWTDRAAALRMGAPLRIARKAIGNGGLSAIRGWLRPGSGAERHLQAASPGETVENWLVRNGQTATLRELLWEPLARVALNQSPRRAAAPPFVAVLARLFASNSDSALGVPMKPLDELYAEPARRFIESLGGSVRTSAPAIVRCEGEGVRHVEARGGRYAAAATIAAVPWYALADLLPEAPALAQVLTAAGRTAACPIATVNLWLDRPVLDTPFLELPGRAMPWVFDKRRAFGGTRAHPERAEGSHLSLVASGADELVALPDAGLIASAWQEVLDALPDARLAALLGATVVREPRATFSLAPGQPARPGTATPVRGLLLAGDWIETGLPATIESAVISGHRAAALAH